MGSKRAGLPQEGGEGAGTEIKKGRGPKGLTVELPPELQSEIKAVSDRIGNGNSAHARAAHDDISALISRAHQEFAKSHIGNVSSMYFKELQRRTADPVAGAVQ